MSVIKFLLFVFLVCLSPLLFAQKAQYNSMGELTNLKDAVSAVTVEEFGIEFPGGQNNERISYSKIKGSRFWKDEWQNAYLYSNTGYIGSMPLRINLVTGELHFLKNSEEFILTDDFITKIIFVNDSSTFISHVPNLLVNKKPVDNFVQVLNSGRYQLLKYLKRNVASTDSLFHTLKDITLLMISAILLSQIQKLSALKN